MDYGSYTIESTQYFYFLTITRILYEVFALLGCYAVLVASCLPTFRDRLSVPFLRIKQSSSLLDPEDKSNTFHLSVGNYLTLNT